MLLRGSENNSVYSVIKSYYECYLDGFQPEKIAEPILKIVAPCSTAIS
jgi:hypothetical protein